MTKVSEKTKNTLAVALVVLFFILVFAVALLATRAMAAQQYNLSTAYGSNGSANAPAFDPGPANFETTFFVDAEDDGTFVIQHEQADGDWVTMSAAYTHDGTGSVEDVVVFPGAIRGRVRIRFTNTDGSAGLFSVEYASAQR